MYWLNFVILEFKEVFIEIFLVSSIWKRIKYSGIFLKWVRLNHFIRKVLIKKIKYNLITQVNYYKIFYTNVYVIRSFISYFYKINVYNTVAIAFIFLGLFEAIFIFEYYYNYINYSYFFYPSKVSTLLIIIFLYFIYIWGISIWRRTQYGKFTRGDRKLWSKGYASFWIVELTTVLGLFLAACWMNWGPKILIPRTFYSSRKGFIIEVLFFSYIIWILYLMRFSTKWNNWFTQYIFILFILLITFLLIWRDLMIILGRDNICLKNSTRWKYITSSIVIYSFVPEWWLQHFYDNSGKKNTNLLIPSLYNFFYNINHNKSIFLNNGLILNDYEQYNFLPLVNLSEWKSNSLPLYNLFNTNDILYKNNTIFFKNNVNQYFLYDQYSIDSVILYPRRVGYQTKRIAMWTLLLFLKLWHHIMLFIWWFFYLISVANKKKNSYSFLSICYFNIYCCFLISLLILLFGYLPTYQLVFKITKIKPLMIYSLKEELRFTWGFEYVFDIIKSLWNQSNYIGGNKLSINSIEEFINWEDFKTDTYKKSQYYNSENQKIKKNSIIYII